MFSLYGSLVGINECAQDEKYGGDEVALINGW